MLIPLIQRFRESTDFELVVLGLTTAKTILDAAGIESVGFRDFVDPLVDEVALNFGLELSKDEQGCLVSFEETVSYLGVSYAELVEDIGESRAMERYKKFGRHAFCPVRFLSRIIDKVSPDLLVSTNSPRAEKAAFLAARDLSIPSICLVDLFGLQEIEWIREPEYASKICVLSEGVREFFIEAGVPGSKILVTGNPIFDRLCDPNLPEKGRLFRKKRGWHDKKILLWASGPEPAIHPFTGETGDPEWPWKIGEELARFGENHPGWQLVIRFHPNETPVEMADNWEISSQSESLDEMLSAADVVVTMSSTVGLEAFLIGCDLIQVQRSVFSADAPYVRFGMARGVWELSELHDCILNLDARKLTSKGPSITCGSATEKIVNEILLVLDQAS